VRSVRVFLAVWSGDLPRFKIDSPEMRRRSEELDAYASTPVSWFPKENDPAFLLFLRFRVYEDEHLALIDFMAQVQKASVGADHQRLANFTKLAAFMVPAEGLQAHLKKDTLATALSAFGNLNHMFIMACRAKKGQLPFRTGVSIPKSLSRAGDSLCVGCSKP
jgi:hypothetical protein